MNEVKVMKKLLVSLVVLFALVAPAEIRPFAPRERVACVGDSITNGGLYVMYLELLWQLRAPGSDVVFENVGIGGNTVPQGLARWDWDVLPLKPNRAFVMFGMNDGMWNLHDGYAENLGKIVDLARASGMTADLATPTPYDCFSPLVKRPVSKGAYEGVARCAEEVRKVAAEKKTGLVEFNRPFTELLKNHPEVRFVPDRVHPGEAGGLAIALRILEEAGCAGREYSRVEVTAPGTDAFAFDYTPSALPLPDTDAVRTLAKVYPVYETYGAETLVVRGLASGNWKLLSEDGREIGEWSAKALAKGVDLSRCVTPGQAQAAKAETRARDLRKAQTFRRRFVVFHGLVPAGQENDREALFAAIDRRAADYEANEKLGESERAYHVRDTLSLKKLVGKQDEADAAIVKARQALWAVRPVTSRFRLVPVPTAATFESADVTLSFDALGRLSALDEKASGRELVVKPQPFAELIVADGKPVAATALERTASGNLRFRFGDAGTAELSVAPFDGGWTFRVESVEPATAERLSFCRFLPVCTKYVGTFANALSDDESFVAVRGYETATEMRVTGGFAVEAERRYGIVGRRAGLAAGPRARAIPSLRAMTLAAGVPYTELGGAWSLGAEGNRRSYYFQDLRACDIDEFVDFAHRIGVSTIHLHGWWNRLGRYEFNPKYYPNGFADFSNTVARLHAEGFSVGMHTLTGCIELEDPWVTPVPSSDFVVDASYTLVGDLAADATEMTVAEKPIVKHDLVLTYISNGNVIKVGDELIQYTGVRAEPPYGFTGLVRGALKTRAAAHRAGTRCDYLHQRYIAFYPAPDSPLADDVADRIARVYNGCGLDQIYFDGSEGMGERYAVDTMRRKVFSKLDQSKHPVLDEASCPGANNWWFHSRLGAWDSSFWGAKPFHDEHHELVVDQARKADFMEPQLGWWCPSYATADHRAHYLDEEEYFASRNAGADVAMSMQGADLVNGPIPSCQMAVLTVVGWYERFRMARAFRDDVRARMDREGAEFRLRQDDDGVWRIRDADCRVHRASGEASYAWTETFDAAKPAAVRVEALYGTKSWDDPTSQNLLTTADRPIMTLETAPGLTLDCTVAKDAERGEVFSLVAANANGTSRGAWTAARREFPHPYRDVGKCRAFGVWVKGDGSGALLNLQVRTPRVYHTAIGEHYARIDFTGWRYLTFISRERDAGEFRKYVWPAYGSLGANIGRNPMHHDHLGEVGIWLNEVPAGGQTAILVSEVRALETVPVTLENPTLTLNGEPCGLPFALASGEYAELEDGFWTRYTANGELIARAPSAMPSVRAGANALRFASTTAAARVEATLFALGEKTPALKPLDDGMRKQLAYEYELPRFYAPSCGADGTGRVAIRSGEKARVAVKAHGPLKDGVLELAQAGKVVRVNIPGVSEPLSGTWDCRIVSSDPEGAKARVEISKRY